MKDLDEWDKDSLNTASRLLELVLKDCYSANTTMFIQLLNGMVDTKAAKEHTEHGGSIQAYKSVIQFCADRIFTLEKQRKTVKLLKDMASEYGTRNEYIKKHNENRMQEHLSVGEHDFNSLKGERPVYEHEQSQEQLEAIEEVFSYYSADALRTRQRKLSGYANGIRKDLLNDRLKSVLPKHEQDTITEAVSILGNLKQNFEHAKERKSRKEKRLKTEEKMRESLISKALNKRFDSNGLDKTSMLSMAFYIAYNIRNNGYDQSSLNDNARHYIDNVKSWQFDRVTDYLKEELPRIIYKACFRTTDLVNYEEIKVPDDAVETFYQEWQKHHSDIVKRKYQLFDDLKTKIQVEEIKNNLASNI